MNLTPETILALAPDSASASNGKKLATPAKWQNLNAPAGMLWGQAQGSGKDPYLTGVDLNGLVSKCSCPSRKFPCKHALALLLLHTTHAGDFGQADAPESLQTWVKGREHRAESKEQKTEEAARKEVDPASQAKRRAAREKKVTDGLAALDLFLKDLVRDGLAQARGRPYSDWDTQAARLVDAQASGAARQVRKIPELLGEPAALLTHLAKLHLLCEAWTRRDTLTDDEQADLRTALGFPLSQAEVLARPGLRGKWLVAAQFTEEEDTFTTRRTWLQQGRHHALLLDFAPSGRPLPPGSPLGATLDAEVCFVPSATPQRALLRGEAPISPRSEQSPDAFTLDELLERHAQLLARNPWLERSGIYLLQNVKIMNDGTNWHLLDATDRTLPLRLIDSRQPYLLLAQSGGQPMQVFGEWDGQHLLISGTVGTGEKE
ncbi:SWIM zinc finger family protein [Deinococcus cavernae]|uniref:SWIM zinc finger family protein n=1 Tax=Deinococcus cavernae TaxID=2320857 RepID=A0A418V9M5_9DEIO|nr:SWIM zinc finger family protein [Deinococcus cavernae]RJF72757.1 SWIM zinc finger family protein [Deinococcus cavernae]